MALRSVRLLAQGDLKQGAPVAPRPPARAATPAVTSGRPRDVDLQDRLRKMASARAQQKAAAQAAEAAACKRRTKRKKTALPGLITFKTMRIQVPCTISDMSGTGARLDFPETIRQSFGELEHLPGKCTLVMRADRLQVECEIVWRRDGGAGVRFLGPPVPVIRR